MVIENFECEKYISELLDFRLRLEQELSGIMVPFPLLEEQAISSPLIGQARNRKVFLMTYHDQGISYAVTVHLCEKSAQSKEPYTVCMDLESRTFGDGRLHPSSTPALAKIIEGYGFTDVTPPDNVP